MSATTVGAHQTTTANGKQSQSGYMVWDARCLSEVVKAPETKLIAPLIDGKPDMKQAYVVHVHATYEPSCGHIEIKHD